MTTRTRLRTSFGAWLKWGLTRARFNSRRRRDACGSRQRLSRRRRAHGSRRSRSAQNKRRANAKARACLCYRGYYCCCRGGGSRFDRVRQKSGTRSRAHIRSLGRSVAGRAIRNAWRRHFRNRSRLRLFERAGIRIGLTADRCRWRYSDRSDLSGRANLQSYPVTRRGRGSLDNCFCFAWRIRHSRTSANSLHASTRRSDRLSWTRTSHWPSCDLSPRRRRRSPGLFSSRGRSRSQGR